MHNIFSVFCLYKWTSLYSVVRVCKPKMTGTEKGPRRVKDIAKEKERQKVSYNDLKNVGPSGRGGMVYVLNQTVKNRRECLAKKK